MSQQQQQQQSSLQRTTTSTTTTTTTAPSNILRYLLAFMVAVQVWYMMILQYYANKSMSHILFFHLDEWTMIVRQQNNSTTTLGNTMRVLYPPADCSLQHYNLSDNDCVQYLAHQLARPWTRKPFILDDAISSSSSSSSSSCHLTLIKVPKSASSTVASVVLRLGHRYAACFGGGTNKNNATQQQLQVNWQHGTARDKSKQQQPFSSPNHYHCWRVAPIRDPTSRALSDIYYHRVSLQNVQQQQSNLQQQHSPQQPSAKRILRGLQELPHNYISEYTRPPHSQNTDDPISIVQSILDYYDFLVDVNHMETSLIIWAWLWNVTWGDVYVENSKRSSTYYAVGQRCVALVAPPKTTQTITQSLSTVNDPVHDYFNSVEWKERHGVDRLLSATVQVSLELTRQVMVQEEWSRKKSTRRNIPHSLETTRSDSWWNETVTRWRHFRQHMATQCANETHFPCSSTGVLQRRAAQESCYVRDFGCGHACHDRVWDEEVKSA